MKKYGKWIAVSLVVLVGLIFFILQRFVWLPDDGEVLFDDPTQSLIKVHALDVGQADAIVIELPEHRTMMIDVGTADRMDQIDAYLSKLMVRKIDILVLSHFHSDHTGDFEEWIHEHDVGCLYIPSANSTKGRSIKEMALAKDIDVKEAQAGMTILNEDDLMIEVLAPLRSHYENENDSSVVVKVTYINNKFLFTGDASSLSEKEMLAYGVDPDADVIKIAHHGADSSSSMEFLQAVSPKYAIISVGENNGYGFPSADVNKRLADLDVKVFRTDRDGTVVFLGNGQRIAVRTKN